MATKSKRIRKVREPAETKVARTVGMPAAQVTRGGLVVCDAPNPTAGETRTVRRLTRVEQLAKAGAITKDQSIACEWYAAAHEMGFQTVGCTANYGGAGGGGFGSSDLLATGCAVARRKCRFPSEIVPTIMATVETTWSARRRRHHAEMAKQAMCASQPLPAAERGTASEVKQILAEIAAERSTRA